MGGGKAHHNGFLAFDMKDKRMYCMNVCVCVFWNRFIILAISVFGSIVKTNGFLSVYNRNSMTNLDWCGDWEDWRCDRLCWTRRYTHPYYHCLIIDQH